MTTTNVAVRTFRHLGDSAIVTGAVYNVAKARPDLRFRYTGWCSELWKYHPFHQPEIVPSIEVKAVYGGEGRAEDEFEARWGNVVEGFTHSICRALCIPQVPIEKRRPVIPVDEFEIAKSNQWRGVWVLNANHQDRSVSKGYPYWQEVVDILHGLVQFVQVGSCEKRNHTHDLKGVIDLRGKTEDIRRDLIPLLLGCDGILTPPSGVMNIGAAWNKPAVIVNGAREPKKLTDYDNMTYVSTELCGCDANRGCCSFTAFGNRACRQPVEIGGEWYSQCMAMIPPERIADAVLNVASVNNK